MIITVSVSEADFKRYSQYYKRVEDLKLPNKAQKEKFPKKDVSYSH